MGRAAWSGRTMIAATGEGDEAFDIGVAFQVSRVGLGFALFAVGSPVLGRGTEGPTRVRLAGSASAPAGAVSAPVTATGPGAP